MPDYRHATAGMPRIAYENIHNLPEGGIQYPDWMRHGACVHVDPEVFFPAARREARDAIAICSTCPVRTTCAEEALHHGDQTGVWAGVDLEAANGIEHRRQLLQEVIDQCRTP